MVSVDKFMSKEERSLNNSLKKDRLSKEHQGKIRVLVEYYVSINKDIDTIAQHVGISNDEVVRVMAEIGKAKSK